MRSPPRTLVPPRAGCGTPDKSTGWSNRRSIRPRPSHPPCAAHALPRQVSAEEDQHLVPAVLRLLLAVVRPIPGEERVTRAVIETERVGHAEPLQLRRARP